MISYDCNKKLVSEEKVNCRSFLLAERNFNVKTGIENGEVNGVRS